MNATHPAKSTSHPTLKTPQELIHIQHRITLRQYKYWILMLRAYREAYETGAGVGQDGYYALPISVVADRMGYRPSNNELRADLEAIRKEPIIYNALSKDGTPAMRGAGFISTWQVSAGFIGFTLPEMLSRCVEQLDETDSIFHLLNWSVFSTFSGKHEANLYKLCKDYVGVRRTPQFTMEKFREYMGIGAREYPEFKALNRYVIADPIQRINESAVSDITVDVQYQRHMRKVVSLQFLVQPKHQTSLSWGDEPAFEAARSLIPLGLQKEYLKVQDAASIRASIDRANMYIDDQTNAGKSVRNAGGIYRKAIIENWGAQKVTNEPALVQQRLTTVAAMEERARASVHVTHELEQSRANDEKRWEQFMALSDEKRSEIVDHFVSDKKLLRRQLRENGLESIVIRKGILQSAILQRELDAIDA